MLPKSKPKLVVGLGNPGDDYKYTRHNVGVWFVHALGHRYGVVFKADKKFQGELTEIVVKGHKVRLLFPTTFMNLCGVSIRAVCDYYQIEPEEVLVAHDELDLDVGDLRLKYSGGHGGHNGLRDTSQHLGKDYWRLRIGVGHPGNKKQVSNFLTKNKTPRKEEEIILAGIENMIKNFEYLMSEGYEKTMHKLHSKESSIDKELAKEKTENKKKINLSKKDNKKVKQSAGKTALAVAFEKAKLEEE